MFYTMIFSLLTIGNLVSCSILDCENQYLLGNPVSLEGNLFNCANTADGHGNCYGPGRVYFGDRTTWTYKDLEEGESISCINTAFGCDPVPGYPKQCYITLYQSVYIAFSTLKILKTNDDGINGDGVEEWHIVNDGTDQQITMNVDFKDEYNSWNGCNFDITQLLHDGNDCKPPSNTEDADGFYECQMYGNTDLPVVVVKPDVYESGLKYTFNIKMGDYDSNGEVFDNGPTFDFTYTEPDFKSIADLRDNDGIITRYFTRSGPEGRKARIYVTYTLIESEIYPFENDGSDMDTCNYQSVEVSFDTVQILKTNYDGASGGDVEEWNIVNDGTDPQITMNVDFKDDNDSWNGCNFDITQLLNSGGLHDCKPPSDTEDTNGFYECQMYGNGNTDLPMIIVKPDVYESGLKYTFNIKMGDYDANGVFDNGPTFDFTYTESEFKSISDLKNNDGIITRYFTRSGPEGRKARIYVTYKLIESDTELFQNDASDIDNCNL